MCVAVVCGSGVQKRLVLCKLTTSSLFGLQSNPQKDQVRILSLPTSWVTNWIHICLLDEKHLKVTLELSIPIETIRGKMEFTGNARTLRKVTCRYHDS